MRKRVRSILVKILNFSLIIFIIVFFVFNRTKLININGSINGHLPRFNKQIEYNMWEGEVGFLTIPNPYTLTIKENHHITEYISLSEVILEVGKGNNFNSNIANTIKNEKLIRLDNAYEFREFSVLANSSFINEKLFYLSANYCLGTDIDFSFFPGSRIYPIGNNEYPFVGTFDGQGFELKNFIIEDEERILQLYNEGLSIPNLELFPHISHYALFANVGEGGKISKLGIINPILQINFPRPQRPLYPEDMEYAASLVGLNNGLVEYVYCIDDRDYYNAGWDVRGGFKVSGLIAENNGTFRQAYYSGRTVVYSTAKASAIFKPVVYSNNGILNDVFFDNDIFLDRVINVSGVTGKTTNELIFKSNCLTDSLWKSYDFSQYDPNIELSYPKLIGILEGLGTIESPYLITNPIDLIFFSKLIDLSDYFRDKHYVLTNCIDMRQVSKTAYIPPESGFSGSLDGKITQGSCDYNHPNNSNNHSIINLGLTSGRSTGGKYYVGIFSQLLGVVQNINFINCIIENLQETDKYLGNIFNIGILAGSTDGAQIINVHTNSTINLNNPNQKLGLSNVGGLVGYGDCEIIESSNSGNIIGGVHDYINDTQFSQYNQTIGGLLGSSSGGYTRIISSTNTGTIEGFSYNNYVFTDPIRKPTLIGGVVGNLLSIEFINVSNSGLIRSSSSIGENDSIFIGGIFGKYSSHKGGYLSRYNLKNTGNLVLNSQSKQIKAAGLGIVNYQRDDLDELVFLSVINEGQIIEEGQKTFSYDFAGLIYDISSGVVLYGGVNRAIFNITINNTKKVNPLYYSENNENNFESLIINSSNYGVLNISIDPSVTGDAFISGITCSNSISIRNTFNYGNINLINVVTSNSININIAGLISTLNFSRIIEDSHNEGDIKFISTSGNHNLNIAGFTNLNNVSPSNDQFGTIQNVTNNGLIEVRTITNGIVMAAGIVNDNKGLIKDVANLNDIAIDNRISDTPTKTVIGGIASLNSSEKSQIIDTVNYGNLYGKTARHIFVGGILGEAIDRLSVVKYGINYGNVYAYATKDRNPPLGGSFWSGNYVLNPTPHARSGGIIASGLLSFNNVINKGLVASNDTVGGVFGFIITSESTTQGIEMSDSINYGEIKNLSSLSMDVNVIEYQTRYNPSFGSITEADSVRIRGIFISQYVTVKRPYGGFIGYIWQQNNNRSANKIQFRYLLNVDSERNFSGRGAIFIDFIDFIGGTVTYITEGNADISTIASTKAQDNSDPPFNNIRSYRLDNNNDIRINRDAFTTNNQNALAFQLGKINIDENGHVVSQTNEICELFVNVDLISTTSTPYSKYRTYNFLDGSLEDVTFKFKLYNNNIVKITDDTGILIENDKYSINDELLTFHHNYLDTLSWGLNIFRVFYTSSSYIEIEINKLEESSYDETFFNLRANNYTFNRSDSEQFLDILIDLNYRVKAVVNKIYNVKIDELDPESPPEYIEISNVNYQYIGIYSDNFFMRKDSIYELDAENNKVYLLHDYIFYLTQEELPPQHQSNNPYGSYVISTSEGRTNGALFPVNINLDQINQIIDGLKCSDWQETISSGRTETITQKFINMQQIGKNKQTTIFNLILESENDSDIILTNPYVDNSLGEIVYYASTNTQIANTYKVSMDGYHIAHGAQIYSKYYAKNDPRNKDIYSSIFSRQENSDVLEGSIIIVAEDEESIKEYQIKIIFTNTIEFANPEVKVNSNIISEFSVDNNILNIFDNRMVHFKNGTLEIDFRVTNLPNGYNILENLKLYDDINFQSLVDLEYYTLTGGGVKSDLFGKDTSNPYWLGNVSLKLTLHQILHSGRFYLVFNYYSKTYTISFAKMASTENFIYNFSHETSEGIIKVENFPVGTNSGYMYSKVDFGKLLDFNNIFIIYNLPSYLSSISISPFSYISEVSLNSCEKIGQYYQYVIHIRVVAETGSSRLWIHEIIEKEVNKNPYRYLKDGIPTNSAIIEREEKNVTMQIFYDISNIYGGYQYISYQSPISRKIANSDNFIIDEEYEEYLNISIDDSLRFSFNELTLPGDYKISFKYNRSDNVIINGVNNKLYWDFSFNDILIIKNQNHNSYLNNITFTGGNERTRFPQIVCSSHIHPENNTIVIQGAIIYGSEIVFVGPNRCDEFNVVGYVSNINLSYYSPLFDLPIGASVYRLDHIDSLGNEVWTTDLYGNFTLVGSDGMGEYVVYKVVSEDEQFSTRYNVQVIDITYNIRFLYNVIYVSGDDYSPQPMPEDLLNKILYITFNSLETENNETNEIQEILGLENKMSSIYLITENLTIKNHLFNFNKSGYYAIEVDLPDNYEYEIEVQDYGFLEDIGFGYTGKKMYAQPTTTIRTYQINIYIKDINIGRPWGIRTFWDFYERLFS